MQIHLVGGAVRDELMGVPAEGVRDRDWVVIGATPQDMLALGYRSVGLDFPVFLHPQTQEEHALARVDRRTSFPQSASSDHSQAVTLEEDLSRRDLTMNAIAKTEDGLLIDPYGGAQDIRARIFRHVGESFRGDPVRILRVARLAARYPSFTVAPETLDVMRGMVDAGAVDHLVPERIWKEISRGLEESHPSRMLQVLRDCGALARILPELDCLYGIPAPAQWHPEIDTGTHIEMALDYAAKRNAPLAVRFATLAHDLGKGLTEKELLPKHHAHEIRGVALVKAVCERWKVPTLLRELACLVTQEHGNVHACLPLGPEPLARLLERCGAAKHPGRFEQMLLACECDARGRLGLEDRDYFQVDVLRAALQAVLEVDVKAVVASAIARGIVGENLQQEIQVARLKALQVHHALVGQRKSAAPR